MSFDQDPNEQAQISGADFALMCEEMKQLKALNSELAHALAAAEFELRDRRCIEPRLTAAIESARAVLAKHKLETA